MVWSLLNVHFFLLFFWNVHAHTHILSQFKFGQSVWIFGEENNFNMLEGRQVGGRVYKHVSKMIDNVRVWWMKFIVENCSRCQLSKYYKTPRKKKSMLSCQWICYCHSVKLCFKCYVNAALFTAYLFKAERRSAQFQNIGLFIQPFSCFPSVVCTICHSFSAYELPCF